MTDKNEPRKRFRLRRLTSFSLRTALIAITVLAVWLGLHMHSVRKQRMAIEAVQRHGGSVQYDYFEPTDELSFKLNVKSPVPVPILKIAGLDHFHSVVSVILGVRTYASSDDWESRKATTGEELIQILQGLPRLQHLWVSQKQLTDRELQYVGCLKSLRTLRVSDAHEVTDQGVACLAKLKRLKHLSLGSCQITDESVRILSALPKLESLWLRSNRFTDEGLAHVQTMAQLRSFCFSGEASEITDDGLIHLKQLTNLERLGLEGSHVTEDGLRHLIGLENLEQLWLDGSQVKDASWLKERLPNCKIHLHPSRRMRQQLNQ